MLTVGSLFAGIGGIDLGLERTGKFIVEWQCEIDPFCQKVLDKHWPNARRFDDIRSMKDNIPYVDVICGGFPCQPVSFAGKRKGCKDERWMWPEYCRVVREVRPKWVIIENVPGILSAKDSRGVKGGLFAGILRDLSESGYDAEWNIISAASLGAKHLRKRVFIVAHPRRPGGRCENRNAVHEGRRSGESWRACVPENAVRRNGVTDPDIGTAGTIFSDSKRDCENVANSESKRCCDGNDRELLRSSAGKIDAFTGTSGDIGELETTPESRSIEPRLGVFVDGLSSGLDETWRSGWEYGTPRLTTDKRDRTKRLKALGNAVVPQCAEYVGRCIVNYEERQSHC